MPATSKAATKRNPLKKKAAKRNSAKKSTDIKYADKSPGQPQLVPIFSEIKKLLAPYEKGSLKFIGGTGGQVSVVSMKPVEIMGRKKDELWFAGALVQKGYVGFYYMPVYVDPSISKLIKPGLLRCLKGKSCFHIKKYDEETFSQIKEALRLGYDAWKKRGWIY